MKPLDKYMKTLLLEVKYEKEEALRTGNEERYRNLSDIKGNTVFTPEEIYYDHTDHNEGKDSL